MKKFSAIAFLILAAAGFMNAQTVNRSEYERTTLFDYKLWANKAQSEDTKKFKALVAFSGQTGTDFYFDDFDGGNITVFEVDRRWPAMERNQRVTIYFTSTGRWSAVINDIDYSDTGPAMANATASAMPSPSGVSAGSTPQNAASPEFAAEAADRGSPPVRPAPAATAASPAPARPAAPAATAASPAPARPAAPAAPVSTPVFSMAQAAPRTPSPSAVSPVLPAGPRVPPTYAPMAVKTSGSTPQRGSSKFYRVQVGAFLVPAQAAEAINKLKNAGLYPVSEKYGNYTRVVFPGIRVDDISRYIEKLSAAGFREVWCREE